MSLYELFVWLSELDFPSIAAIWTWMITVPWWLAIVTVVFTVYAVRISWYLAFSFFSWLSNWMYEAGGWMREFVQTVKHFASVTLEFGRTVRKALIP